MLCHVSSHMWEMQFTVEVQIHLYNSTNAAYHKNRNQYKKYFPFSPPYLPPLCLLISGYFQNPLSSLLAFDLLGAHTVLGPGRVIVRLS